MIDVELEKKKLRRSVQLLERVKVALDKIRPANYGRGGKLPPLGDAEYWRLSRRQQKLAGLVSRRLAKVCRGLRSAKIRQSS